MVNFSKNIYSGLWKNFWSITTLEPFMLHQKLKWFFPQSFFPQSKNIFPQSSDQTYQLKNIFFWHFKNTDFGRQTDEKHTVSLAASSLHDNSVFSCIPKRFSSRNQDWLVVSTHLKNISQNGNLPHVGRGENEKCLKPPARRVIVYMYVTPWISRHNQKKCH